MEDVFKEDFIPQQAIIVFKQGETYEKNYYLESRRIEHTNIGYQMQEGTPLSKSTLSKVIDEIKIDDVTKISCGSIFPKNLLYYQIKNLEPHIIWYVESGPQNLLFKKSLGIKNGTADMPALVFKLMGRELSVFAIKTNRPTEKTLLYKAPFHNVYDDGNICMGNAVVDESYDVIKIMNNYQKAFFNSRFSHLHGTGSPIDGNLNTYLNRLIKTGDKFNKKILIRSKQDNIGDLL